MQRSTRFNRPGLRGSANYSLLNGGGEAVFFSAIDKPDITQLDVVWGNVPDLAISDFQVAQSADGIFWTVIHTTADATPRSYTVTGLSESTLYYFRVTARNGLLTVATSTTSSGWTVPATPTSLTATAVGGTQINLSWTDVSTGNTGQIIERRTPSGSGSYSFLAAVNATATSYSDTGLTAGQSYEYRVAATNPEQQSAYSNAANATPSATPVPSWTLDFSSGEPWANGTNYTFSSTASTTRTFVNNSGYVAPCVANILLYSEQFNQSGTGAWTTTTGLTSIGSNVTTAPDGTTTADELVEDSTTGRHRVASADRTVSQSLPYTASCYVKASNRSFCALRLTGVGGTGARFTQVFDLTGSGSLGSISSLNSPTGTSATITAVGSGWFRVTATMNSQTNTSINICVSASDSATPAFSSNDPSYAGAGNSAIYVWGAQLEQGSAANTYSATTTSSNGIPRLTHNSSGSRLGLLVEEQRANILSRSTDFSTTWAGGNTNVPADSVTAPDNLANTTSKIAANTTNAAHWRRLSANSPVVGTTYVYSVFFKAGGGAATHAVLLIETSGTVDRSYAVKYDTATGARTDEDSSNSPVNTGSPAQAESYPNGWYRAWVRIEHSTGNSGIRAYVGLSNAATGIAFPTFAGAAGDADFIWFWGAQVEASTTTPTSFIPTVVSSVTRSADLAHVLDTSITSWGDPGALVVHFYPPSQAGTLLSTDDASAEQLGIEASSTTAVRAFWSNGQTATDTMTTGVQKAVHYWSGTASSFCLNGGTVQTGTNNVTTFGNIDFVTFGAEATDSSGTPGTFSQYANCIIRKIEFYSGTLTSGDLQTITT